MVVGVNGVFGGRMADVAERVGAEVTKIERPFGEVFTPEEVAAAVKANRPKVVGIVHAETSTGAHQPLEEIAKIVHDAGALLIVDCVTSLGGLPVEMDRLGIDAAYSGSQKVSGCPPGLAPVTFGPKRWKRWMLARSESPAGTWTSGCFETTGATTERIITRRRSI